MDVARVPNLSVITRKYVNYKVGGLWVGRGEVNYEIGHSTVAGFKV